MEPQYETSDIRPEARAFFTAVTGQGWKVEEASYDNHFTWPAAEVEIRNNSKICRFLREDLSNFVGKSTKAYQEVYPKDVPRLEAWKEWTINSCCGIVKR